MVLGIRSKSRKSVTVQVDYLIHVQEIKPWPLSQSQKSAQSVFLQWENGDQASGSFTSGVGDGKIEFTESFRLPVTLCKEASRKSQVYQKNNLEFYLYESRKDKAMKGQLLGSAVINLADYGIIGETISVTAPVNCKKSSKNSGQPVLYINIQPLSNGSSSSSPKGSLSKEASLDNAGSESVSEAMLDGNDEEAEIASFTDDDVASHSLRAINSSAFETTVSSTPNNEKIEPEKTKDVIERNLGKLSTASRAESANTGSSSPAKTVNPQKESSTYFLSTGYYSNPGNPANDNTASPNIPQDGSVPMLRKSVTHGVRCYPSSLGYQDDPLKAVNKSLAEVSHQIPEYAHESRRVNIVANLTNNAASSSMYGLEGANRNRTDSQATQEDGRNVSRQTGNGQEEAITFDNSTYSSRDIGVPRNVVKNNKLKRIKSVQLPSDTVKKNGPLVSDNTVFIEKPKRTDMMKDTRDGGMTSSLSVEKDTSKHFSDSKGELKAEIEMLKEELREAAAVEVGLYSVVAEHGSSTNKIHAPARRISRFYFHACKASSPSKKANAARAAISGFILVSKACGNDVPRLTFWLSNSIMLRAIVSQTLGTLSGGPGADHSGESGQNGFASRREEKNDKKENFDDWNDHKTFLGALEKFEFWIFSRIVESVWWQTMTPHMQSAAAKSKSRKASGKKYGFADHEQGNFSIELWKKAFKDACQRLCPSRAGGHECGCLPVLARLVMEQLVDRLDVAMFNAILRENAEEMPTDPVSDPISDSKVLPIPAGRTSFGAGAQLKNAIGSWSRCLADIFDIDDAPEDKNELNEEDKPDSQRSFKAFRLLNALSDLMMIPYEMLADKSTRKEVCPTLSPPLIRMVLYNFVPDDFCPNPIPEAVLEALDSEDDFEVDEESVTSFPCTANPTVYAPPSATSLTRIIGEVGSQNLLRSGSVLRKSYTSDDELDELDSPFTSITKDNYQEKRKGDQQVVRYQLLREVWKASE